MPARVTPSARPRVSPLVLIIRDGWGENPNPSHASFNAVEVARGRGLLPVDDRLRREWPRTLIKTSGEDVGLPGGTMGNSEVGHQNIGAGRIVPQESLVMTKACEAGLHTNAALKNAIQRIKSGAAPLGPWPKAAKRGRALHLLGINSDAGVHGQLEHLYAILRAAKKLGAPKNRVFIHLFTDGRDTGPFTGRTYAQRVGRACAKIGIGRIASVVGRYYAMDRDHRWERVAMAYSLLTGHGLHVGFDDPVDCGRWAALAPWLPPEEDEDGDLDHVTGGIALAPVFETAAKAIGDYYKDPDAYAQTDEPTRTSSMAGDEFLLPRIVAQTPKDVAMSRVRPGDSVIFFNYRGDRPRELSAAFCFPDAEWAKVKPSPDSGRVGFDRGKKLNLHYTIMTEYWEKLLPHVQGVAFPRPPRMKNIGGEVLASLGLRQFRCAETEKYPHVTFFFNDYRDEPFPGESRENPQSPRVATYDMKPEMAAGAVTAAVLKRLAVGGRADVLIVNFANGDMVGHTGNLEAAVKACAAVDAGVGAIMDATLAAGGALIITADHGNCEQMFDPATDAPHTAHTVYDVPLFVVGPRFRGARLRGDADASGWFRPEVRARRGRLADIAPTALAMMGLPQPPEMTGVSLLA
ncbi:MAG: 2,3-bisphosphoglycerate-independent phosphoglycerate mutase [Phycisphaerae bacterium]|nr:2,3-bisphosphoglycerate-independent phosphoglycerate mutase [Phycisphaerae bacterium]